MLTLKNSFEKRLVHLGHEISQVEGRKRKGKGTKLLPQALVEVEVVLCQVLRAWTI